MPTQPTKLPIASAPHHNSPPYAGFGAALRAWLLRADRSQQELATALKVRPSTVSRWVQGQKRPDARLLVKLLAAFRGWFGEEWDPLEAQDAIACLGHNWSEVQEASERYFEKGGRLKPSRPGGRLPALRHNGSFSRRGLSSTCPAALSAI